MCRTDSGLLQATPYRVVEVTDPVSQAAGIAWWEELTGSGGEGMVVKPLAFIHRGGRGLAQPAVKCRGREYLRIIYGPDYTAETNLARLRPRGLGRKRSLALGEFALGIEGLERFVRGEPLRRVHECVFGVLALRANPSIRGCEGPHSPGSRTIARPGLAFPLALQNLCDAGSRHRVDQTTFRRGQQ